MEDCVHTRGKSCVQKMKHLYDFAMIHNLTIIDQSQPSCRIEPWILVQTHTDQAVRITYTWEDKKIATEEIQGILMTALPQEPGQKISYEIII